MDKKIIAFKLPIGIKDREFCQLAFGRQIEYLRKIQEWKSGAMSTHLSQKRKSWRKALREFVELYKVTEYYATFHASEFCRDDTFEIFYKTNPNNEPEPAR